MRVNIQIHPGLKAEVEASAHQLGESVSQFFRLGRLRRVGHRGLDMTALRRIRRGDVIRVKLDPVVAHEIGKARPAVVVQNDVGNEHSPTLIVVALTGYDARKARFPICATLDAGDGGLDRRSIANASQIRTRETRPQPRARRARCASTRPRTAQPPD